MGQTAVVDQVEAGFSAWFGACALLDQTTREPSSIVYATYVGYAIGQGMWVASNKALVHWLSEKNVHGARDSAGRYLVGIRLRIPGRGT